MKCVCVFVCVNLCVCVGGGGRDRLCLKSECRWYGPSLQQKGTAWCSVLSKHLHTSQQKLAEWDSIVYRWWLIQDLYNSHDENKTTPMKDSSNLCYKLKHVRFSLRELHNSHSEKMKFPRRNWYSCNDKGFAMSVMKLTHFPLRDLYNSNDETYTIPTTRLIPTTKAIQ